MPLLRRFFTQIPAWNCVASRIGRTLPDIKQVYYTAAELARAYGYNQAGENALENSLIGVFLDRPDQPTWAREIARYHADEFRDNAAIKLFSTGFPGRFAGGGAGKRAINWNYALKYDQDAYKGAQITGNCVWASFGWELMTCMLGYRLLKLKAQEQWRARGATAYYCFRGHCGQGANMSRCASVYEQNGFLTMSQYCGGKYDFTDFTRDQQYGMEWCRAGAPDDLVAETRKHTIGKVASFDGDAQAAMDILYVGGCLHTGSTSTAAKNGDPVSSGAGVGPHAQTCYGYDDTEEFRTWYAQRTGKRLTEPVFMFGQTWGDTGYVQKNWPTELWGRMTPGIFVLPQSAAWRLIGSDTFAYWPDFTGFALDDIDWSPTL